MSTIIMATIFWKYLTRLIKYMNYYLLLRRKPEEIAKHVNKSQLGLDIGAGAGQYTTVLLSMGYNVTAVEPDIDKIQKSSLPFVVAKAQALPFPSRSYDFAFTINVIHHTKKRVEMLKEVARVADRIIISEINKGNIFVRLYNMLIGEPSYQHITKLELMELIRASGLKLRTLYSKSFFGIPNVFLYAVCDVVKEGGGYE